jgi:two-component system cell cycle response regulator
LENPKIKVLLAEDRPEGSPFWEKILSEIQDADIEFIHTQKLSDLDQHIGPEAPDVILLDLSLSNGGGLEVFLSVYGMVPMVPIIVITGADNQMLAVQTALEGAQDCLVKNDLNGYLLIRAMRYAIGRQKHLKQLSEFSMIDELTGLYNRRGFLTLANQQIKVSDRTRLSLLLVFVDVDGLKVINDSLGHHRGDLALMETAHVLREAFRETDILGRLGGDEFVALLNYAKGINEESIIRRFRESLEEHNRFHERSFKLLVSLGVTLYDPLKPCSTADLLARADSLMYDQKRINKLHG